MVGTSWKKMFGIKHYWIRYEFTKGRGQIHAHLLAITKDSNKNNEVLHAMQDNNEKKLKWLSDWCKEKFDMTAECGEVDNEEHDFTNLAPLAYQTF